MPSKLENNPVPKEELEDSDILSDEQDDTKTGTKPTKSATKSAQLTSIHIDPQPHTSNNRKNHCC
jgi:hypothetical protein